MVAVVNHLAGHATIYTDVLARDETRLVATEEQHHVGNVHGVPYPARRLLGGIGTLVNGVCRVYPAGRDGVHSCFSSQAYCQCVSECSNATTTTLSLNILYIIKILQLLFARFDNANDKSRNGSQQDYWFSKHENRHCSGCKRYHSR